MSIGITVRVEMAPSLNTYISGGNATTFYVSYTTTDTQQLVDPVNSALNYRNPPQNDTWTPLTLIQDSLGLYHADQQWEGFSGKIEIQALAQDASSNMLGAYQTSFWLNPWYA